MVVKPDVRLRAVRNWTVPFLAAVCVIIATVFLARSLREREHHHIEKLTEMAMAAVKADLDADLDSRFLDPVRTTSLWNVPVDLGREKWDKDAHVFLSEHPFLSAVARVTPDGRVWSIPPSIADKLVAGLPPSTAKRSFLPARDPYFGSAFVDDRGERFRRIVLPLPSDNGQLGYGIAAFRESECIDELLSDVTKLGYSFVLTEGDQEIYRHTDPATPVSSVPHVGSEISVAGIQWRLRVWPDSAVAADPRSALPTFVLAMGLALSVLVAISVHFAQSARRKNRKLTREVAQRQRYETALQASQARLNGILETSADGVVVVDEQQRIILFNKGAETIFGYSAEEVLTRPLDMLIPEQFQQSHRVDVSAFGAEAKERPRRMAGPREVFGRKKDGTEFPLEASISKVVTAEGVAYTSIVRDVTDRVRAREDLEKAHQQLEIRVQERTAELADANDQLRREIAERQQAEMRLRLSEGRMQAILDNCTASIFMKDLEGRLLLINRWYETLFGVRREDVVGKTDFDFLPRDVAARFRRDDEVVIRTGAPLEFEETITHPDGSVHTYVAGKFLVRDGNGKPYALCGIATDITRQKEAEELLSELSGGLIAMQDEERKRLSRELHEGTAQMLAAVEMNLEVAKRMAREDHQKVASAIDVSLELVEQSASQLRTMAYLLHPPGLDDFGLGPALRWYADGFSTRSGIRVGVEIDTEDSRFDRDVELAVFRIVQEALTNILRHSNSKTAEIVLRQRDSDVEVEISDFGTGIASDIMDRMSSGKTVPGIGIAGIRERVRQLHGVFGIHSGPDGVRLVAKLPTTSTKSTAAGIRP